MRISLPLSLAAAFVLFLSSPNAFAQDWYTSGVPEVIVPQPAPYHQSTAQGGWVEYPSSGYYGAMENTYTPPFVSQEYTPNYYPNHEPVAPMPGSYQVPNTPYYTDTPYTVEVYQAPAQPSQPSYRSGGRQSLPGRYNGVSDNEVGLEIGEPKRRSPYERGTFGGSYQAGGVYSAGVDSRFGGALQPGAGRK